MLSPLLHREVELRFLCQLFSDGCSVCSGLLLGGRWWSVGGMPADEGRPGLDWHLYFCCGS